MTRDEYKEKAVAYFNKEFIAHVNFPILLREAAITLFLKKELNTKFSLETRRRLNQLTKLGYTD